MRYTRAHRLTTAAELRRVQHEGKPVRTRHLSVRACASPLSHPRIGVVVPRHGHSAVRRNQLKRRLREIARVELLPQIDALDVVIRARETAYDLPFAELRAEVIDAVRRVARIRERE